MSKPRKSFYILLPLVSVALTLLIAELGFSLFAPVPFSLERNLYYEPDPDTGYRHRPGTAGQYLNKIPAVANSRGQRDDEVEVPKPAGVFRVLVVGDSFTVGANVPQDDAYPQVLERLLNGDPGSRIEVVNAGTGGWAPFQYAQFVERHGDTFEPDLLIVGLFVGNDIYVDTFSVEDTLTAVLGRRVSRSTGESPWGALKVFLYEHSNIARLALTQHYDEVFDFHRQRCDEFGAYFLGVQKTRLANHLARPSPEMFARLEKNVAQIARMRHWADARGIPFVVFVFPDENQINPALQKALLQGADPSAYDFDNPQALLRPLFALNAIEAADLLTVFRNDPRCLYQNDSHWTPEGHALVAAKIRDYLLTAGYVPHK